MKTLFWCFLATMLTFPAASFADDEGIPVIKLDLTGKKAETVYKQLSSSLESTVLMDDEELSTRFLDINGPAKDDKENLQRYVINCSKRKSLSDEKTSYSCSIMASGKVTTIKPNRTRD